MTSENSRMCAINLKIMNEKASRPCYWFLNESLYMSRATLFLFSAAQCNIQPKFDVTCFKVQ